MRRRSVLFTLAIVVLLVGGVGAVLGLLVRHEPGTHRQAATEPGPARQHQAEACNAEFLRLADGLVNKRDWSARFTETMINSYLEEELFPSASGDKVLPEGVREPRVRIHPDHFRLSFRYGSGTWSTVVSIDLCAWLAAKEPNVVVLELQAMRAGSLPVSAQSLLERISEAARQQGLDVTWYRHRGNPVAVVRFQPYQSRPTFQLQRLELGEGSLHVVGRSLDAPPPAEPLAARTETE